MNTFGCCFSSVSFTPFPPSNTQHYSVSAAGQVSSSGSDFHGNGALLGAAPCGLVFDGSSGLLDAPGVVANGSQDGHLQVGIGLSIMSELPGKTARLF